MKNSIYAGIVVVCILVAVIIMAVTRNRDGSGIDNIPDTQMVWVRCMKCNHSHEMGERQFHRDIDHKARANPSLMMTPLLTCTNCSQDAVIKAVKCEKCGEIFREYAAGRDNYGDRCPKCKYSHIEATRKARLGQQ